MDFHERSLWPTLERIRHLRIFASCQDGHTERYPGELTWPAEGFARHVAGILPDGKVGG